MSSVSEHLGTVLWFTTSPSDLYVMELLSPYMGNLGRDSLLIIYLYKMMHKMLNFLN